MRSLAPASDSWTLAVHDKDTGFSPLGTAIAISARRALTCAHVLVHEGREIEPLWVSFPMLPSGLLVRRLVHHAEFDRDNHEMADVAVLHLVEDMPAGVEFARLLCPEPKALVGKDWWAFGFPASSKGRGNEADGTIGARLGHGWVRLDTVSRFVVEKGFSGGGLWSPDYEAVVGIVGSAFTGGDHKGDAQALSLIQADLFLPQEKLRLLTGWSTPAAGVSAMAAWGWSLQADPEAGRHWRPRARGVTTDTEQGHRFRGRTQALRRIVTWLDREMADRQVLLVTGSPGVGKSAVLGRVVTTADPQLRTALPDEDTAVVATVGSVACAVHAKGKTALEVAKEIARAASAVLPEQVEDLAGGIRDVLAAHPRRFNVVIDALDEASSPSEARTIAIGVVLPLVQTCAEVGAQVIVGTRRRDDDGNLLDLFAKAGQAIDLDEPEFFELDDLEEFALATLRLVGAERPDNPYDDVAIARPVARRIAELADRNFLIAGLDARMRGMYDTEAADPQTLTLTATIDATLNAYLKRLPPVEGLPAHTALTALAYAEAPGWTGELWHTATTALGRSIREPLLDQFARSSAANFLVETSTAAGEAVFRLFHQGLNDALLRRRADAGTIADEKLLTRALIHLGRTSGWANANMYLLRSLSGHATRAKLIDELLEDDQYPLHADLMRLIPAAANAENQAARNRARLLRLTPHAIGASPPERAAQFSVTEILEGLPSIGHDQPAPYRGRWAKVRRRQEHAVFDGHTDGVYALCPITVEGRTLLASAGDDDTIRIWDPATGTQHTQLDGHTSWVRALCPITVEGRTLLASAGDDRTIRIWDPATGHDVRTVHVHHQAIAVAQVAMSIMIGLDAGLLCIDLSP